MYPSEFFHWIFKMVSCYYNTYYRIMKKSQIKKEIAEIPKQRRFNRAAIKKIAVSILLFVVGGAIGSFITFQSLSRQVENAYLRIRPLRQNDSEYKYINPLLACIIPNSKEFFTNLSLENKVKKLIDQEDLTGKINSVSVYYRDLVYGRWIGIDENEKYDPASMLKVVIMMAFYKQAEGEPEVLNKTVTYTSDVADEISVVPLQTPSHLKIGGKYTIEKLIEAMIVDSDNGAKNALLHNINERSLSETYSDLGIDNPDDSRGNYTISSKSYSLFLRILYNATYLDKSMSEKALGILVRAKYKDGIAAGISPSVLVAQKFGEHIESSDGMDNVYELHDCGIVYKPEKPYLLCVMTKGTDLSVLTKTIQDISRLIFNDSEQ